VPKVKLTTARGSDRRPPQTSWFGGVEIIHVLEMIPHGSSLAFARHESYFVPHSPRIPVAPISFSLPDRRRCPFAERSRFLRGRTRGRKPPGGRRVLLYLRGVTSAARRPSRVRRSSGRIRCRRFEDGRGSTTTASAPICAPIIGHALDIVAQPAGTRKHQEILSGRAYILSDTLHS
jgi:hypothetical protein